MNRRNFLSKTIPLPLGLVGAGLTGLTLSTDTISSSFADYKALVIVFLNGGNDGNNVLVPTDSAYLDYANIRGNLALSKNELLSLKGTSIGHSFGIHPALPDLANIYNRNRLAFISNVGPLIKPVNAKDVRNGNVEVPSFLYSHTDQTDIQLGWQCGVDQSGWAGRAIDLLPFKGPITGVSLSHRKTLVTGNTYSPAFAEKNGNGKWGQDADLTNDSNQYTQILKSISRISNQNIYSQQYAVDMQASIEQSSLLAKAYALGAESSVNFSGDELSNSLKYLSRILPILKSSSNQRQVFYVEFGEFDTHSGQRGLSSNLSQDSQLIAVNNALASFDNALISAGISQNVTTLVMSEFSRTLKPAAGNGSDHAWGNHWWLFGDAVSGGKVYGDFPSLVLNGVNDADPNGNGRFAPTTATDQVASTLLKWLDISSGTINNALPNLKNFNNLDLGLFV
jgi:uncharacterized protein (DUF1501 family)